MPTTQLPISQKISFAMRQNDTNFINTLVYTNFSKPRGHKC
jgi:hypothetical protein